MNDKEELRIIMPDGSPAIRLESPKKPLTFKKAYEQGKAEAEKKMQPFMDAFNEPERNPPGAENLQKHTAPRWEKSGYFIRGIKLGPKTTLWPTEDVEDWIDKLASR